MPTKAGFTLIEILIVIVIMGITLSMATLSFGDFGASRKAKVTAEQFATYIKLVQQRAILEVNTYAINISRDGYETLRFDSKNGWQPMPANSIFHKQAFPKNITVHLQVSRKRGENRPDILINASGDLSAFNLTFGPLSQPQLISAEPQKDGTILIKQAAS